MAPANSGVDRFFDDIRQAHTPMHGVCLERSQCGTTLCLTDLSFDMASDVFRHHCPAADALAQLSTVDATMQEANHVIFFSEERFQAVASYNAKV
jgi:hypothetical protein